MHQMSKLYIDNISETHDAVNTSDLKLKHQYPTLMGRIKITDNY